MIRAAPFTTDLHQGSIHFTGEFRVHPSGYLQGCLNSWFSADPQPEENSGCMDIWFDVHIFSIFETHRECPFDQKQPHTGDTWTHSVYGFKGSFYFSGPFPFPDQAGITSTFLNNNSSQFL